ncbi:MAG TPA: TlpA disulfide reductase family protein [Anaerolineales bacterium]|nr:TlpA disulfide reductase family protein [Anaerolineales bacterium]
MEAQSEKIDSTDSPRRPAWVWILVWTAVLALLVLVALGLRDAQAQPVGRGEPAPGFSLQTFEGDLITLESLRGKVVVLNFWASWCKPCEQEAADLQTAWEIYEPSGDVVFLGVDYVDTEREAAAYIEKFSITYPNGPDLGQKIYDGFRATGVPETYFIDRDGVLYHTRIGPFTSLAEITAVIDAMLEQ